MNEASVVAGFSSGGRRASVTLRFVARDRLQARRSWLKTNETTRVNRRAGLALRQPAKTPKLYVPFIQK
jgi:hypothetical protein